MSNVNLFRPKTREGKIAKAFVKALPGLTPLLGKHSNAVIRKKTWQAIRTRVPGVTQAVVTRTLFKLGELLEWKIAFDEKWRRGKAKRKTKHG